MRLYNVCNPFLVYQTVTQMLTMNAAYGTFGQSGACPEPEATVKVVTFERDDDMDAFPDWFHSAGIEKKMEEKRQEKLRKQAARMRAAIVRLASRLGPSRCGSMYIWI